MYESYDNKKEMIIADHMLEYLIMPLVQIVVEYTNICELKLELFDVYTITDTHSSYSKCNVYQRNNKMYILCCDRMYDEVELYIYNLSKYVTNIIDQSKSAEIKNDTQLLTNEIITTSTTKNTSKKSLWSDVIKTKEVTSKEPAPTSEEG